MQFERTIDFDKDLKKLLKKHRTLEDDLAVLKKVLNVSLGAVPPRSFTVEGLGVQNAEIEIIIVKKFSCKALKGRGANSGIRLTYIYHRTEQRIVFIEIYFKTDQKIEDKDRLLQHLKGLSL